MKLSHIIIVVLLVYIIASAAYHFRAIRSAYSAGYNSAIEQAELYKFSNDGYFLRFGEEVHEYKF